MPNGKGTPACGHCRHCLICGVNVSDRESHGLCTLWNTGIPPYRAFFDEDYSIADLLLPPEQFRNLNVICKDYDADRQRLPNRLVGRLRRKVSKTLLRGLLYAAPYNVIDDPSEYHRVVCILDKDLRSKSDAVRITDSWMEECVEEFVGKHVNVNPLPMLQALWSRIDNDRIISVSEADTYGKKFRMRIEGFWDYLGKRYGGIGRVEQEGHILDTFWIVFSVSKVDTFNFSDPKHHYHITVGPEKPIFWRSRWPVLDKGSPRLQGMANIKI